MVSLLPFQLAPLTPIWWPSLFSRLALLSATTQAIAVLVWHNDLGFNSPIDLSFFL